MVSPRLWKKVVPNDASDGRRLLVTFLALELVRRS